MTIKLNPDVNTYNLYVNVMNITDSTANLVVKSQFSNDILFQAEVSTILSNDRYTHFQFEPTINLTNDINGIYEYVISKNENIIDQGLIKIINKGNELPTKSYVSKNETRKSKVLYRPNN